MLRYGLIRLTWMLFLLVLTITLVYFSTRYAQMNAWSWSYRMSNWERFKLILNEYPEYISNIFRDWNWGVSRRNQPVWELFLERLPVSLRLNFYAFLIYFPLGLILGTIAAVKKDTIIDHLIAIPTFIMSSIPTFIWVFLLIMLLGYTWGILPPRPASVEAELSLRVKSYIIPVTALALVPMAKFTSMIRGELLESFQSDYLLLLKTKGLTRYQAIKNHLFKDSMVPIVPEIIPTFIFVLISSFFVEIIYNMQGVSALLFNALFAPMMDFHYIDIDTKMTVVVTSFYVFVSLFMALIVDLSMAFIDPRIKIGAKKP